ncbi:MAG: hypothetical protein K0Q68_74 [Moraxellaceae bacterium]|jgi:hypothetical protein|nr:hypothetical protein [Moraxellaceae bacterium]
MSLPQRRFFLLPVLLLAPLTLAAPTTASPEPAQPATAEHATPLASPAPGPTSPPALAATAGTASPPPRAELLWEIDPYYSSAALEIPLTELPLPDGGQLPEIEVYTRLLRDSLRPRLLLLEASVYPLPILGTWYKRKDPGHYDEFQVGTLGNNQLNLLDGVTAGFQEPWALSAFIGSGMQFTREGQASSARNRGYMGYLVSYGARHIHNNVLIDDNWWELEWKLKGEREFREEELHWSFRMGVKNHGHPEIADVGYIGLRRSNLNYENIWLSLLNNSDLELLTEIDRHSGRYLRQEAIIGRKLPLRRWRVALSLDIGVIYEDQRKYTGALSDPSADTLTFVLRPHLRF